MGIKSITERPVRYAKIGTIRKGAEKPEKGFAKNLDYFRFALEEGYEGLAPVLVELFGEQPSILRGVELIGTTPADTFDHWLEKFGGNNTLIRRCDGEKIVKRLNEGDDFSYNFEPIACLGSPACGCKQVGRLKIKLPQLKAATGVIGYFALSTHSWNDIARLHDFFTQLYLGEGQVPLSEYTYDLYRETELINTTDNTGKKGKRNESLLAFKAYYLGEKKTLAAPTLVEDTEDNDDPETEPTLRPYTAGLISGLAITACSTSSLYSGVSSLYE